MKQRNQSKPQQKIAWWPDLSNKLQTALAELAALAALAAAFADFAPAREDFAESLNMKTQP